MKRSNQIALVLSIIASFLVMPPLTSAEAVSANPTPVCSGANCTITFAYTGDYFSWTVPSGVTSVTFDVRGARGGNGAGSVCSGSGTSTGASGGKVTGTLNVTSGSSLFIYVGGRGEDGITMRNTGGWNGGGGAGYYSGAAVTSPCFPGSGGGASDIRTTAGSLATRLVVAGGGGGGGGYTSAAAGAGGGLIGGDASYVSFSAGNGKGGTQSAGGAQGTTCAGAGAGALGLGGNGAGCSHGGGGGGGGYFGGGGGIIEPGGGGSSFTDPTLVATPVHTQGNNYGDGQISITYLNTPIPTTFSTSQSSPTNIGTGSTVSYSLVLSQSVSDLAAADFQFGGTSSCNTPGLTGSGTTYTVAVTNCSAGTLILQLKANSVTGTSAGPPSVASANTIVIDRVAPTFSAPQSYPTGVFYPGNTLTFNMLMNETVTVTGNPRIPLTIGVTTRYATYSAGTNTKTLSFTYTVASSLDDIDGDNIEMISPAQANGGSITDLAGNAMSVFTFTPPALSLTVAQPPSAPTITSITPSSGQLSVAFTSGNSNGASISKYQYSTDNGSTWKDRSNGTNASPLIITTVSASVSAIVNGTAYNIRLRGVSLAGNGDSSIAISGTPSAVVITGDSTLVTSYGQAASTGTYTSAGGTGPYTYTLSTTPSGVSISAGVVAASSSTPAGTYTQNVVSTDSTSQAGLKQLTITVNKASTSISIALPNSASNAALGGAVTITATVPRAGAVNFMLGGATISGCGSASAASTSATCTWTPVALGSVSLTAIFTPTDTSNFETSTATTLVITVVNGISTVTLSLTGGTTTPPKGQAINIIAAVDILGKITILVDGKRIPGCFNKSASVGNVICSWKPAVQKESTITARLVPTNNIYNPSNATLKVQVTRRTGTR